MQTLVLNFANTNVQEAALLSVLLRGMGINVLTTSNSQAIHKDLDFLFHQDFFVLLVSKSFLEKEKFYYEFVRARKSSNEETVVIPILLEDVFEKLPCPTNRFVLAQDYNLCVDYILATIEKRKDDNLPFPFDEINLN